MKPKRKSGLLLLVFWMLAIAPAARAEDEPRQNTPYFSFSARASGDFFAGSTTSWGGSLSLGFRHFRDYSDRSGVTYSGLSAPILMMMTLGLAAVPYHVLLGNERGLDVQGSLMSVSATDGHQALLGGIGLSPAFYVNGQSGWRFPSIVGVVLPEIGLGFQQGKKGSLYLRLFRLPFGYWFDRHLGVELTPSLWYGRPPWKPDPQKDSNSIGFFLQLSFLFRT